LFDVWFFIPAKFAVELIVEIIIWFSFLVITTPLFRTYFITRSIWSPQWRSARAQDSRWSRCSAWWSAPWSWPCRPPSRLGLPKFSWSTLVIESAPAKLRKCFCSSVTVQTWASSGTWEWATYPHPLSRFPSTASSCDWRSPTAGVSSSGSCCSLASGRISRQISESPTCLWAYTDWRRLDQALPSHWFCAD